MAACEKIDRPVWVYSVEKLGARLFGNELGGLKPSPD